MHSKRCLAAAIIAAVENLRDTEGMTDMDFRMEVQANRQVEWADSYLNDGTMTCSCGEYDVRRLFDVAMLHGARAAQDEAEEMLKANTLTPDNYMRLARRLREQNRNAEPDTRPLPEDISGHAVWGPFNHDDGRRCYYHARLGVWAYDDHNECLRPGHPHANTLMQRRQS